MELGALSEIQPKINAEVQLGNARAQSLLDQAVPWASPVVSHGNRECPELGETHQGTLRNRIPVFPVRILSSLRPVLAGKPKDRDLFPEPLLLEFLQSPIQCSSC